MTTLVVGASGATGRLVVEQLLAQEEAVKIIVRSAASLPDRLKQHKNLTIRQASLLDMSDAELQEQVQDCQAIISCLGHNLSFKGIFGKPRRLVTDAMHRLSQAAQHNGTPLKIILMNSTGCVNPQARESISRKESLVIGLLRHLLPPHADNEEAAAYLQTHFDSEHQLVEWVAVRPDSLIDEEAVSPYQLHASPVRSAIFDSGKTSRINVANFMSRLILDQKLWNQWRGQRPVIYNSEI